MWYAMEIQDVAAKEVIVLLPENGVDALVRAEGLLRGDSDEPMQLRLGFGKASSLPWATAT